MKTYQVLAASLFLFLSFNAPLLSQPSVEVFVSDFHQHELRLLMENNAGMMLSEINRAKTDDREPALTSDSASPQLQNLIRSMWHNGVFYIPESRIIENVAQTRAGYYEMRNIPVYFINPEGEEIYEEAIIQFDANGVITDFRIGLPAHRYNQLLREGLDVTDQQNRQDILTFVESFRTAYNTKDIEYIKKVFSDQALIIVGRVVENTGYSSAFETQVEFMQYTKDEYIVRLGRVFDANVWIDVGFEDIKIRRHPKHPDMYGVQLTQFYNSSIYSDVGYIFLLIDFLKPSEPMIHVRTWQPRNITPEEAIFSIGDMEIF